MQIPIKFQAYVIKIADALSWQNAVARFLSNDEIRRFLRLAN